MKSKSKSNVAANNEATNGRGLFARLETSFKSLIIKLLIERELDEEVIRSRKTAQMRAVTGLKKQRPRRHARTDKKTAKASRSSPNRSLPKVLNMQQKPIALKEPLYNSSDLLSLLSNAKVSVRRLLIPNQADKIRFAKATLQKLADRITACQKLIQEVSIRQHELHTKAQQVRRVADKLNRRAARQKKSNELLPKQVAEANRQASKLERSASQYAELQKLRLPILKSCLERLEDDSQKMEMLLIKSKTEAMTELLNRFNSLMNKTVPGSTASAQAIARAEQIVADREAKLTEALDCFGSIIKLSPTIFEGMEEKVMASEELAKASSESVAKLPDVETKSMNLEQVKQALTSYAIASKEITNSYEAFAKIEEAVNELIVTWQEREKVWQNRQSSAELDKNTDLAKEANKRARAATDTIGHLKQSLEAIPANKEPLQKRLNEINLVSAKLEERLAELEQKKEQQTNAN